MKLRGKYKTQREAAGHAKAQRDRLSDRFGGIGGGDVVDRFVISDASEEAGAQRQEVQQRRGPNQRLHFDEPNLAVARHQHAEHERGEHDVAEHTGEQQEKVRCRGLSDRAERTSENIVLPGDKNDCGNEQHCAERQSEAPEPGSSGQSGSR